MKKLICSLGMISFLTMGVVPYTHAQEEVKVKRSMSKRGKGAIIGGAGGAVVGGLIGHGVGGALIGGAAGAGAGYLIGRKKDREMNYERPIKVKHKYHD